jgi:hypothetical protein
MLKNRILFRPEGILSGYQLESLEIRRLLAATLPLLPAIIAPASNPALPSGFDTFSPQGITGTPSAGTPGIAQWTQSGNPNDTLAVSITHPTALPAADNSSDTEFFTYGQTTATNGALVNDTIEQIGGGVASVNLSSANTPNSMYLLWAENADGFSSAVAINKANAWWVGPNQASPGQTVSVYGQNLTFSPTDGLSWVYITQAGSSTGQWATVTSANPYQVSFTIPTGLATGNYQVWVHNGHGGEYGWSSPVTLSVVAPVAFNGPVFNVLNFGAVGNGVTDSTAAFLAAESAAAKSPGSTVYVPTGNYIVSQFRIAQDTVLVGDGAGKSNILESPTSDAASLYTMVWLGPDSQVENLTLDDNNTPLQVVAYGRFMSNIQFTGVTINGDLTKDLDIHGDQLVSFDDCNFIGDGSFLGTASQLFFNDCNFYATNDAEEMLFSWGGDDISITNCTVQNLNDSNPNSGAGWGQGLFFVGNNLWGSQSDTYIGNNTTIAMGVRPAFADQNVGEQLLWEAGAAFLSGGTYLGSTANTVTYTGLTIPAGSGYNAIVVAGDGVGEYVPISSYDPTTGVITLAGAWAATPDSTSVIRIGQIFDNIAVYDNSLQGRGVTDASSAGVQFWGNAINCDVDSNTISGVRTGILDAAQNSSGNVMPNYFNLIQNNTITNVGTGISIWGSGVTGQIANVGSVARFNTVSTASLTGFFLNAQLSSFYVIVEGNDVTGSPTGLDLENTTTVPDDQTAPTYLTLSDNSFSLGSAAAAGSMGIDESEILMLTEAGNTFTGFAQTDGGTINPTILSPVAAAPGTQFPPTTAFNGTTSSPPAGGSGSASGSGSGATSSGKSKSHPKKRNSAIASAPLDFAAVSTTPTNNLKFSSTTPGNDAAVLAA